MDTRENLTNIDPAVYSSQKGYGNQLVACGILLRLGYEASLAETGNSFYDLILILRDDNGTAYPIKTGVRTLSKSLDFTVNKGGGIGRPRPQGRGPQIPTLDQVQLWIGITSDFDLYYLPHKLICNKVRGTESKVIGSLSKAYLQCTLNNNEILNHFFDDNWLEEHILRSIPHSETWQSTI